MDDGHDGNGGLYVQFPDPQLIDGTVGGTRAGSYFLCPTHLISSGTGNHFLRDPANISPAEGCREERGIYSCLCWLVQAYADKHPNNSFTCFKPHIWFFQETPIQ